METRSGVHEGLKETAFREIHSHGGRFKSRDFPVSFSHDLGFRESHLVEQSQLLGSDRHSTLAFLAVAGRGLEYGKPRRVARQTNRYPDHFTQEPAKVSVRPFFPIQIRYSIRRG